MRISHDGRVKYTEGLAIVVAHAIVNTSCVLVQAEREGVVIYYTSWA